MQLTIEISEQEHRELQRMADRLAPGFFREHEGITPEQIVSQFVADLTESPRSRGSDERELAADYFRRAF